MTCITQPHDLYGCGRNSGNKILGPLYIVTKGCDHDIVRAPETYLKMYHEKLKLKIVLSWVVKYNVKTCVIGI